MKLTAVFTLLPVALAAPSQLNELNGISKFKRDLPDLTPVNIPNLDIDFDIKCGKTTIKGRQIHRAVSWGTCLQRAEETVGSTHFCPPLKKGGKESPICPSSTDKGVANEYPHKFRNYENFKFQESLCNDATHREEFPIRSSGVYEGDEDDEAGKWRAIYVHDPKSKIDYQGNPTAYYCGTVYHKSNSNDFIGCDIKP
ncbi:MAG: hypothetical protein Q9209_007754 [Squamulea sp. 1 TL-2023]